MEKEKKRTGYSRLIEIEILTKKCGCQIMRTMRDFGPSDTSGTHTDVLI